MFTATSLPIKVSCATFEGLKASIYVGGRGTMKRLYGHHTRGHLIGFWHRHNTLVQYLISTGGGTHSGATWCHGIDYGIMCYDHQIYPFYAALVYFWCLLIMYTNSVSILHVTRSIQARFPWKVKTGNMYTSNAWKNMLLRQDVIENYLGKTLVQTWNIVSEYSDNLLMYVYS